MGEVVVFFRILGDARFVHEDLAAVHRRLDPNAARLFVTVSITHARGGGLDDFVCKTCFYIPLPSSETCVRVVISFILGVEVQILRFGVFWVHRPGSHARNVTQELRIECISLLSEDATMRFSVTCAVFLFRENTELPSADLDAERLVCHSFLPG